MRLFLLINTTLENNPRSDFSFWGKDCVVNWKGKVVFYNLVQSAQPAWGGSAEGQKSCNYSALCSFEMILSAQPWSVVEHCKAGPSPLSVRHIQKLDFLSEIERCRKHDMACVVWWDWLVGYLRVNLCFTIKNFCTDGEKWFSTAPLRKILSSLQAFNKKAYWYTLNPLLCHLLHGLRLRFYKSRMWYIIVEARWKHCISLHEGRVPTVL